MQKLMCKLHKDQKGAALVGVLVVVLFLSILATTILYMSGSNIQTKRTDYESKVGFYEAERVIEIMRTQLVSDVSKASKKAYDKVLPYFVEYSNQMPYTRGSNQVSKAQSEFEKEFYKAFKEEYEGEAGSKSMNQRIQDLLGGAATIESGDIFSIEGKDPAEKDTFYFDFVDNADSFQLFKMECTGKDAGDHSIFTSDAAVDTKKYGVDGIDFYLVLRDVCLVYTDVEGYTSVIRTSFVIAPPAFNWNPDGSFSAGVVNTKADCMTCVMYKNWEKE